MQEEEEVGMGGGSRYRSGRSGGGKADADFYSGSQVGKRRFTLHREPPKC